MSMINTTVKGDDIRKVVKLLRTVEPNLLKQLRKDMRNDIKPYAAMVTKSEPKSIDVPTGFLAPRHATRWTPSKSSISFTPGKRRKARSGESNLLSIAINPVESGARGYYIMELAGTRSSGSSPQGQHLISLLNGRFNNPNPKAGRFFWKAFFDMKSQIVGLGEKSIQAFGDAASKEI